MPKLKHESGGRQIEVSPDMVPMYESQGWRKVPTTTTAKTAAKPTAGDKK